MKGTHKAIQANAHSTFYLLVTLSLSFSFFYIQLENIQRKHVLSLTDGNFQTQRTKFFFLFWGSLNFYTKTHLHTQTSANIFYRSYPYSLKHFWYNCVEAFCLVKPKFFLFIAFVVFLAGTLMAHPNILMLRTLTHTRSHTPT